MSTLRLMIIAIFGCFIALGNLSCSREDAGSKQWEEKLFAPLSEQDINHLIKECKGKADLLERCGTPIDVESSNGLERIEFRVSFDNVNDGPTPLMIASFVVVVSNDVILSWYTHSVGRVRGRLKAQ